MFKKPVFVFFVFFVFFANKGYTQGLGNFFPPGTEPSPQNSPLSCRHCGLGPLFHHYKCPLSNYKDFKGKEMEREREHDRDCPVSCKIFDCRVFLNHWTNVLRTSPDPKIRTEATRKLRDKSPSLIIPIFEEFLKREPTKIVKEEIEKSLIFAVSQMVGINKNIEEEKKKEAMQKVSNLKHCKDEVIDFFSSILKQERDEKTRKMAGSFLYQFALSLIEDEEIENEEKIKFIESIFYIFKTSSGEDISEEIRKEAKKASEKLSEELDRLP